MHIAANQYGSMEPIKSIANTKGSRILSSFGWVPPSPALTTNAPYKDKDTKQADPIAKPFPIAAVVFPAASKASVLCLTCSPS